MNYGDMLKKSFENSLKLREEYDTELIVTFYESIMNELSYLYSNKISKEEAEIIVNKCENLIYSYNEFESGLDSGWLKGVEILLFVYKMWIIDKSNLQISFQLLKDKINDFFDSGLHRGIVEYVFSTISLVVKNYEELSWSRGYYSKYRDECVYYSKSSEL